MNIKLFLKVEGVYLIITVHRFIPSILPPSFLVRNLLILFGNLYVYVWLLMCAIRDENVLEVEASCFYFALFVCMKPTWLFTYTKQCCSQIILIMYNWVCV